MQLKLWRFVGFVSSIVGLLCYALSSSFIHIFGKWNYLKLSLYTLFSFIICVIILFARTWQHSTTHRFKAHSAFLVLTITSVYSFFTDKILNGKPDAYSLISCASFALMSLSLSTQIQCGFELDLMSFYLGCLIVQLMKIHLSLAILGFGYSYCLVTLRSSFSSSSVTHETQCVGLEEQQWVVIQVDSQQRENTNSTNSASIVQHFHTSLELILQQFRTCMKELEKNNSHIAKMLVKKVKGNNILVGTDHNFIIDSLSHEAINSLQNTAKLMVDAGFEKECIAVYNSYRKEWLEDVLINKLLRMGNMVFQDFEIDRWIKTSEVALKVLFPSERRLYNRVFSDLKSESSDLYFSEVCRGATIELLNFADLFASGNPSVWRLFKILNLIETLSEFESLCLDSLVNEAVKIKNRLSEISKDMFMEFGDMIFHTSDAEFDCWIDGGVHPMTCVATGYIVIAFWSKKNLEQVLQQCTLSATDDAKTSSFYTQIELIMEQFERKLEYKSQIYEDPALRNFFMMNNLSHLKCRLETFWDDRFCDNTEQYFELYCRNSWDKVINFLKMDIKELETDSLKDNLNMFNHKFKEMCEVHSTWRVFNEQLKKHMIISIENILLPAYENFIGMFHNIVGKNAEEYIMYEISDIQDHLNNSFILQDSAVYRHFWA